MERKILFNISIILLYVGVIFRIIPIPFVLFCIIQFGVIIYAFYIIKKLVIPINYADKVLIYLLLGWVIFNQIRGIFVAETYWDWKQLLIKGTVFTFPVFSLIFSNIQINRINQRNILKYASIAFVILSFMFSREGDVHGRFLSIFFLLIICFRILPKKWKIITLISIIYALTWNFGARSTWIKAIVCFIIGISLYFPFIIKIFKRPIFFIINVIPVFLLVLGILGIFNIFKIGEELNLEDTETNKEMTADTRTALYEWVLSSSVKNNYVLWGRTPARGYESPWLEQGELALIQKRMGIRINERAASEVSIHNVFTYYGVVGVLLYAFVIIFAVYRGLYQSSNIYIKGIALFLLFRWLYSWIEEFTDFDYTYLSLWIFVGMCYSTHFRSMNNNMFKKWLLSCLS